MSNPFDKSGDRSNIVNELKKRADRIKELEAQLEASKQRENDAVALTSAKAAQPAEAGKPTPKADAAEIAKLRKQLSEAEQKTQKLSQTVDNLKNEAVERETMWSQKADALKKQLRAKESTPPPSGAGSVKRGRTENITTDPVILQLSSTMTSVTKELADLKAHVVSLTQAVAGHQVVAASVPLGSAPTTIASRSGVAPTNALLQQLPTPGPFVADAFSQKRRGRPPKSTSSAPPKKSTRAETKQEIHDLIDAAVARGKGRGGRMAAVTFNPGAFVSQYLSLREGETSLHRISVLNSQLSEFAQTLVAESSDSSADEILAKNFLAHAASPSNAPTICGASALNTAAQPKLFSAIVNNKNDIAFIPLRLDPFPGVRDSFARFGSELLVRSVEEAAFAEVTGRKVDVAELEKKEPMTAFFAQSIPQYFHLRSIAFLVAQTIARQFSPVLLYDLAFTFLRTARLLPPPAAAGDPVACSLLVRFLACLSGLMQHEEFSALILEHRRNFTFLAMQVCVHAMVAGVLAAVRESKCPKHVHDYLELCWRSVRSLFSWPMLAHATPEEIASCALERLRNSQAEKMTFCIACDTTFALRLIYQLRGPTAFYTAVEQLAVAEKKAPPFIVFFYAMVLHDFGLTLDKTDDASSEFLKAMKITLTLDRFKNEEETLTLPVIAGTLLQLLQIPTEEHADAQGSYLTYACQALLKRKHDLGGDEHLSKIDNEMLKLLNCSYCVWATEVAARLTNAVTETH